MPLTHPTQVDPTIISDMSVDGQSTPIVTASTQDISVDDSIVPMTTESLQDESEANACDQQKNNKKVTAASIASLPNEVLSLILWYAINRSSEFSHEGANTHYQLKQVCKRWYELLHDEKIILKQIRLKTFADAERTKRVNAEFRALLKDELRAVFEAGSPKGNDRELLSYNEVHERVEAAYDRIIGISYTPNSFFQGDTSTPTTAEKSPHSLLRELFLTISPHEEHYLDFVVIQTKLAQVKNDPELVEIYKKQLDFCLYKFSNPEASISKLKSPLIKRIITKSSRMEPYLNDDRKLTQFIYSFSSLLFTTACDAGEQAVNDDYYYISTELLSYAASMHGNCVDLLMIQERDDRNFTFITSCLSEEENELSKQHLLRVFRRILFFNNVWRTCYSNYLTTKINGNENIDDVLLHSAYYMNIRAILYGIDESGFFSERRHRYKISSGDLSEEDIIKVEWMLKSLPRGARIKLCQMFYNNPTIGPQSLINIVAQKIREYPMINGASALCREMQMYAGENTEVVSSSNDKEQMVCSTGQDTEKVNSADSTSVQARKAGVQQHEDTIRLEQFNLFRDYHRSVMCMMANSTEVTTLDNDSGAATLSDSGVKVPTCS